MLGCGASLFWQAPLAPRALHYCCLLPFLQKAPRGVTQGSSLHTQPWVRTLGSPCLAPCGTGPHTWLAHAPLDTFRPSGGQGAGLLCKAAVPLLSQLPEAGPWPRAGPDLHADRHLLEGISETQIVTDRILPAFWSRPEKGEVLSVDRAEWYGKAWVSWGCPILENVLPWGQEPQSLTARRMASRPRPALC